MVKRGWDPASEIQLDTRFQIRSLDTFRLDINLIKSHSGKKRDYGMFHIYCSVVNILFAMCERGDVC